jgi:signal transduction histidine kinase
VANRQRNPISGNKILERLLSYLLQFSFALLIAFALRLSLGSIIPDGSPLTLPALTALVMISIAPAQAIVRYVTRPRSRDTAPSSHRYHISEEHEPSLSPNHPPSLSAVQSLARLERACLSLDATLEIETLLDRLLDSAIQLVNTETGLLLVPDEESGELRVRVVRPPMSDSFLGTRTPLDERLLSEAVRTERCILVNPSHKGDRQQRHPNATTGTESRAMGIVPLLHQGSVVAVIQLVNKRAGARFTAIDQMLIASFARHAAAALGNVRLRDQLGQAAVDASEFISAVSHELKTPLTSILGYTDLLLSGMSGELEQQQRRFLETIAANVDRMGSLIHDLTDITQLESGQIRLKLAPFPVEAAIDEALPIAREICGPKEIDLCMQVPDDLPSVFADKDRLVQLLTILLKNAGQYSEPGSRIKVSARAASMSLSENAPSSRVVICSVQDKGLGVTDEEQESLFTRFFRSDDSEVRKVKGVGLGLAIAKTLTRLHGGKIWLESSYGEGSTFHLALPQAGMASRRRAEQRLASKSA